MSMTLADCFSRIYAINLRERRDRLVALLEELETLDLRPARGRMEIFPGVRPESAGEFPNRGVRGCFLSHASVLRLARDERLTSVLVLEDDVAFAPLLKERLPRIDCQLREQEWGFVYLGHRLSLASEEEPGSLVRFDGEIVTAHCYAVHGSVLPALVEFMDEIPKRPAGHPDGGPMFPDGALSFFRLRHPEIITLVACPSLASQRSSRSDLTPRWFDKVPMMREAAGWLRQLKNRIRS